MNRGEENKDIELMENTKLVIDYLNLDFNKVMELETDVFLLALKCAIMEKLQQTEEGREYIKKCNRLNTTELDVKGFERLKEGGGSR